MQQLPRHVGTIGSTIADGLHMTVYCGRLGCYHSANVDLEAMRAKLGADYPVADFVARSRCGKCGARWPEVSIRVAPIHTGGFRSKGHL